MLRSDPFVETIQGMWQNLLWKRFYAPEQMASVGVLRSWPLPDTSEPTDISDLANIKSIFGLHVSCAEFARVINKLLEEHQCCYRVTCRKTGGAGEIPAGANIRRSLM